MARAAVTIGMVLSPSTPVAAQLVEVEPASRFAGGVSFVLARPVGQFANFVNIGAGFDGFIVGHFDRRRIVGLRFDGRVIIYGSETVTRPLSTTVPRITVDVTTTNLIASAGVGPQVTLPGHRVRPYAFGTVGFSYFGTESSVEGEADLVPFASSTNFDDVTFALAGGGGLLIGLSRGKTPLSLDLSGEFVNHSRTRYLREGGIRDLPDGTIVVSPIESSTNMVLFKVGVAVGIR
jgi:hypothetical protein